MDLSSSQQLTASQREAVYHVEGPLLVLAGPGSGKTRVITCRIAALIESGVRAENICAITFTNKAAEEMRQRAFSVGSPGGAHISTFHSLCLWILRRYSGQAGLKPNFTIYDESDQARCIKQAIKDCDLDPTNFPPGRIREAISILKNKLIDPESFARGAEDYFSQALAKVYASYAQLLAARNALDFDDLLMRAAVLLEGRDEVRHELSDRFRFLLIDEYQDTNHAQYRIARALVSEHDNICATGDPDQSIYGWRGADIHNILAFEKDWPDAKIVRLEENFRSTADILAVADKLIGYNQKRKAKRLVPVRSERSDVVVRGYEDQEEEAFFVACRIKELIEKGVSPKEIAVLYRVNSMSRVLEEQFIRSGIAYQVVRGLEFYNRKEIRDLLAYLKVLVNPEDEVSLARIINRPARGIGKVTMETVRSYAACRGISLFEALKGAERIDSLSAGARARVAGFVSLFKGLWNEVAGPVAPLVEKVFNRSGLEASLRTAGPAGREALENVGELIGAAGEYDRQCDRPSLVDYLQRISLFTDADAYNSQADRVALMTLHAAKGLEFENVFIIGAEQGLLPHDRSGAEESGDLLEEERRLFFVGITRAKTNLQISYSRYRTMRGRLLRTIPSQFLYELGCPFDGQADSSDDHEPRYRQSEWRGRGCRACKFEVGQLVRHPSLGLGRVVEFVDVGENSTLTVKFNTGQTKCFMLKYAGIVKV